VLFNNVLAVGHYQFLYLYNIIHNVNILRLELYGYFGHLYINDERLFVADAGKIYCFDNQGKIIWKNDSLGIDGVYISEFDDKKIYGSGEWDPPGGWRDFVLDKNNGRTI
jgi:outer membrane protein assembly factor BamB